MSSNAWICNKSLDYDAPYFWRVRACTTTANGKWSAVGVFTTEAAPSPAPVLATGKTDGIQETPLPQPTLPQTTVQQITVINTQPTVSVTATPSALPPVTNIQITMPN